MYRLNLGSLDPPGGDEPSKVQDRLQDRTDLSFLLRKERSMKNRKRKIRQEMPLDLQEAIEFYGLEYILEHYKRAMEDLT